MEQKGLYIVVEGIDGCGKSTLVKSVADELKNKNLDVVVTKEPGGTELGKWLRNVLQTHKEIVCNKAEYLLFASDRAQHFHQVVMPALKKNQIIISDRSGISSLAYQGYGRSLNKEIIETVNQWAMHDRMPDLIIFLNIDPDEAFKRITGRAKALTTFELEKLDFWNRVINGFFEIFKDKNNVVQIDALNSQQDVHQQAMKAIKKLL